MKKYVEIALVSIISVLATLSFTVGKNVIDGGVPSPFSEPHCECSTEDITDMYADYIEEWKQEISSSFNKAETKVFGVKPNPDDVVGPDPDPDKCICGGTGVITQGDGHKTPCPYHGSKIQKLEYKIKELDNNIIVKPLVLEEQWKRKHF